MTWGRKVGRLVTATVTETMGLDHSEINEQPLGPVNWSEGMTLQSRDCPDITRQPAILREQ